MEEKVVVLYIRLSKSDDETGKSKEESDSIKSQRDLLHNFLDNHPDLSTYTRFEAVDDGYSGTNANRPMFQKMIQMAEQGLVQAICVKDSSRLFRNYQEAGTYIDCRFPVWDVRFLAITDGYDSIDYKGTTGSMEQALRNIVYASYPQMLSQATVSAKKQMMKQGKYVGGFPPFGYDFHPTTPHSLVIDPKATIIIRRIFDLAIEGKKVTDIAKTMNEEQHMIPSVYFHHKYPNTKKFRNTYKGVDWDYAKVHKILTYYLYTGAMVSHRRKRIEVGNHLTVINEPIVVENTHEGIVTKEEFEQAQKVISKQTKQTNQTKRAPDKYALRSLVRCGNCKKVMTRNIRKSIDNSYKCKSHRTVDGVTCKEKLEFPEQYLEELVYAAIGNYVTLANEFLMTKMAEREDESQEHFISENKLLSLEKEVKKIKLLKQQDYEKYTDGEFSRDDFIEKKAKLQEKLNELQLEITAIKDKTKYATIQLSETGEEVKKAIDIYQKTKKLTPELAKAFVKAVYVHDLDSIDIHFHFKDLF